MVATGVSFPEAVQYGCKVLLAQLHPRCREGAQVVLVRLTWRKSCTARPIVAGWVLSTLEATLATIGFSRKRSTAALTGSAVVRR